MNRKCQFLGLTQTVFKNSHGLSSNGQFSTSSDMLKLGLHASGFSEILKVWGAKRHTVKIEGKNYRTIDIKTTGISQELELSYSILGCKTGTLTPNVFNILMLVCDEDENVFLVSIMQSKTLSSRFMDVKKIIDVARKKCQIPNTSLQKYLKLVQVVFYKLKIILFIGQTPHIKYSIPLMKM